MPTKTANPKTLFGVPLMRIFWLFIYSVVLCLLVGVGVWYFAKNTKIIMQSQKNYESSPSGTLAYGSENQLKSNTINQNQIAEYSQEENLKLKLISILESGDLIALIDLSVPISYDCVTSEDDYEGGSLLPENVKKSCIEEVGGLVPISETLPCNSPYGCNPVFVYEVGCFLCGPALVGRSSYLNILKEHSSDYRYSLIKYGPYPTDYPFYYLFQNSLGDYLLLTTVNAPNSDDLSVFITPVPSIYSVSEIIENLPIN